MRLKRFFSAALSAALLVGLCACASTGTDESGALSAGGTYAGPHFSVPGFANALSGNSSSEPDFPPPPTYDKEHRLGVEIPALINGLEMPVVGATGYTSVELPLWPSVPEETEDAENPEDPNNPGQPDLSQTDSEAETVPGEPEAEPGPTESNPDDSGFLEETEPEEPEEEPDPYAGAVAVWEAGTAFVILEEVDDWWHVARGDVSGWIEHRYCMINLPDVIPSMIYDDTNSYSSLFVSCGKDIPDVTGEAFYESLTDNARLDRQEFMMPILYAAARHVCAAQHRALAEGNCLVVYQAFRPYDTQRAVVSGMSKLAKDDPEVKAGISTAPWSMAWFINTGISNHQRGFALDVSMVKVYETQTEYIGSAPYLRMTDYESYRMPTTMHELSIAAISTVSPSSSQLSETMNEPAIALRGYFTASGLSPLASEWWHFNDNAAMRASSDKPSNGRYFITECLSCLPDRASELLELYAAEVSETEPPEVEPPEMEAPEVESPEIEVPEEGPPEVEAPEMETPEVEPPEMEAPEVESLEIE